jgi:cytochrome c
MAEQGAPIYAQKCAACHGVTGREGPWDVLVAEGTQALRGRMFATTIWDFINRYMPPVKRTQWNERGLLSPDEVYALTAFLLYQNRIIQETEVMDAQSLPKVQMPERDAFTRALERNRRPE